MGVQVGVIVHRRSLHTWRLAQAAAPHMGVQVARADSVVAQLASPGLGNPCPQKHGRERSAITAAQEWLERQDIAAGLAAAELNCQRNRADPRLRQRGYILSASESRPHLRKDIRE